MRIIVKGKIPYYNFYWSFYRYTWFHFSSIGYKFSSFLLLKLAVVIKCTCTCTCTFSFLKKGAYPVQRAPALCGVWEGCQWQSLPSHVQCEETATRTRDLPATGGTTLPLAPGPHILFSKMAKLSAPHLMTSPWTASPLLQATSMGRVHEDIVWDLYKRVIVQPQFNIKINKL